MEKQLENVIKYSINPNILIVVNNFRNKMSNEQNLLNLAEKYHATLCPLNSFCISQLEDFLKKSLTAGK
jgi:hypothetical protein